jgi:soluble lytic murein transglycosylase-like protein
MRKIFRHFEKKLQIPEDMLYSISLHETGKIHTNKKLKMSWPWSVNVEGQGFYFNTKREAVKFVSEQLSSGKESIDVGCMQINLKHHPKAFRSLDYAFDPKNNIQYGATFLREKYEQLGDWSRAIAHYHSATQHLGEKYKVGVLNIAQNIDKYKSVFRRTPTIKSNPVPLLAKKPIKFASVHSSNKPKLLVENKDRKYRSNMMIHIPSKIRN